MFRNPDTRSVLKAYAIGFIGSALAILVVAGIWFFTQPKQEPGLVWGGTVYTSKQDFNVYLKSKGLTYKTWLAKNPGAAPWEPQSAAAPAAKPRRPAPRAAAEPVGDGGSGGLSLTTVGLILMTGVVLLLLLRTGPAAALAAVLTARGGASSAARERGEQRPEQPELLRQNGHHARADQPDQPVVVRPVERVPRPAVAARRSQAGADLEPHPGVSPVRAEPSFVEVLSPRTRPDAPIEREAPTPEAPHSLVCEIRVWRGYRKSQFYVETGPPLDQLIESRPFRARGDGAPEQSEEAVAAYVAMVEGLVFAGWKQDGRGAHWFSDRFHRPVSSSA